jgi:hypothetical protein
MNGSRRSVGYTLMSFVPVAATISLMSWRMGRGGILLASILALPWLAWRYDNETGTFLPLSVLFLFVFAVLGLLMFLLAVVLFGSH